MTEKLKTQATAPNKMRIGRKFAELGFAVLPILGVEASRDMIETRAELQTATEVAQRFNCEITAAEDLHTPPPDGRLRGEKRTTVQVTIDLETNPIAKDALKKYKDDPSVGWFPPRLIASYGKITPANGSYLDLPLPEPGEVDALVSVTTHTYLRTTYPDGARMHIYMGQEVGTADAENSYTTTGFNPCGVLEWSIADHTWSIVADAPKEQPLVTYKSQPWQNLSSR